MKTFEKEKALRIAGRKAGKEINTAGAWKVYESIKPNRFYGAFDSAKERSNDEAVAIFTNRR